MTVRKLDECHRIVAIDRPTVWTLVIRGPRRRRWGFYTLDEWVDAHAQDRIEARP